jgi:hypothetical protein
MIIAAPIRGASLDVQLDAAAAHKEFWQLMGNENESAYRAFPSAINDQIVEMKKKISACVGSQQRLIAAFVAASDETLQSAEFANVLSDLDRIVASTDAVIRDVFSSSPKEYVREWNPYLQQMADLNGHIDNYAESFHVALDDNCSAILAHLADTVLASDQG